MQLTIDYLKLETGNSHLQGELGEARFKKKKILELILFASTKPIKQAREANGCTFDKKSFGFWFWFKDKNFEFLFFIHLLAMYSILHIPL